MDQVLSRLTSLQSTAVNITGGASSKDATSLNREISVINSSDVASAASYADQVASATVALEARRLAADAGVRASAVQARLLLARLAALRTQLAGLTQGVGTGVTAAAIAQLSADIRRTRDDVNSRSWDSVAGGMRSTLTEYQTWINALRQRRDDLAAQLASMTRLLAQFT